MPRNYKKEAAWERENFDQIKFRVRKELGARFRAHLKAHGMTAQEWFKYVVEMEIVPHYVTGHGIGYTCTREMIPNVKDADAAEPCTRNGGEAVPVPCAQIDEEAAAEPCTRNDGAEDAVPGAPDEAAPAKRKKRAPSPTAEMVREWKQRHASGMTYDQIAEMSGIYDKSTVRKRVQRS